MGCSVAEARKLVGYDKTKIAELKKLMEDVESKKTADKGSKARAEEALESIKDSMAEDLRRSMDVNKDRLLQIYQVAKARVFRKCMQKLVDEVRGSQIFVDKSGIPTLRKKPKASLRKVDM